MNLSRISMNRRTLLLSAAAASLFPIESAFAQSKPEKPSLSIGIGPDFGTSCSAVIASQKGYFQEEGFDKVDLQSFAAGLMQVEALAAGGIDIAMPTQAPILTARSNGVPVVIFASVAAYNNSLSLVVRQEKTVTAPTDLYGLKIGVLKGSGAEMMVNAIKKHYGLDPAKIDIVNLAPPEELSSLATGSIDAICVWQPWVYQAIQGGKAKIVHTGTESRFAANMGERVVVDWTRGLACTLEPFVRSNPRTLDALARALVKAQNFIADGKNQDEVVALFSKYQKQPLDMNKVVVKTYGPSIALDQNVLTDVETVQDFLLANRSMRTKVGVPDIVYGAALRKIDPALVSIDARWKA